MALMTRSRIELRMSVLTRKAGGSGTLSADPKPLIEKRVTEMDVEMAAAIASCLMGAVMVGAVLMYAGMHQLITEAYEEGRRDSLGRGSTPEAVADERTAPAPAAAPPTTSAA